VVSNFVKAKTRDAERLLRTIAAGHVTPDVGEDSNFNVWEDEQWVAQMLNTLPPAQREVMAHVYDGLGPTEIAKLLGKTQETVRKNLQLARDRLKAKLKPAGVTERNQPIAPQAPREEAR
jgi:RNA polymerase sigma factor (sigma-70 family)